MYILKMFRRNSMETFVYRCPVCGYLYSVPAYWMSYSAEPTTSFPHMKPNSNDICENQELELYEEKDA